MFEKNKPVILIVDDMVSNLMVLSDLLLSEYEVKIAKSAQKAFEVLQKCDNRVDLILLDIVMPQMDGYEMCKVLKDSDATKSIPVIFVTAKDDVQDEEYGLNIGAMDYITKPFNQTIVKLRVRNQIDMKLKSDMLETLSMYDGLTNIPNRRYFEKQLDALYRQNLRNGGVMSVMMIDIDFFKPYNDNYGHGKGDETLKKVAVALNNALGRGNDFVARYGGEEFVVLLDNSDTQNADEVAQKLLQSIRDLEIEHAYSKTANKVTISIGIFTAKIDAQLDKESLLKRADEALYKAKDGGKDKAVAYE